MVGSAPTDLPQVPRMRRDNRIRIRAEPEAEAEVKVVAVVAEHDHGGGGGALHDDGVAGAGAALDENAGVDGNESSGASMDAGAGADEPFPHPFRSLFQKVVDYAKPVGRVLNFRHDGSAVVLEILFRNREHGQSCLVLS